MVECCSCFELAARLEPQSVALLLTDPPYGNIVPDAWDRQWKDDRAYAAWMVSVFRAFLPALTPNASVIFFGAIGWQRHRPLFKLIEQIEEESLFFYQNMVTWGKRRAYGTQENYLFCREEILWYSVSEKPDEVTFHVPYLAEKRGYAGFNAKYPAHSEYKRATNVWSDITEVMNPRRVAEKPIPLMERLVRTHSNEGDLIVDPFVGSGATYEAAIGCRRRFRGCDTDPEAVQMTLARQVQLSLF